MSNDSAFKINLIYYINMLLFYMHDLSIVHVFLALGVNLILKLHNFLLIQKHDRHFN